MNKKLIFGGVALLAVIGIAYAASGDDEPEITVTPPGTALQPNNPGGGVSVQPFNPGTIPGGWLNNVTLTTNNPANNYNVVSGSIY